MSFNGQILNEFPPWRIARQGVARTFQNLRLFRKLTVLENVLLGIRGKRGEGFLDSLLRFKGGSPDHLAHVKRADELIDFVGLSDHRNELADNLSYGQQKLLSIACCLAGDPQLLLLDEPVAGVQPEMIKKIEGLIKELVHKRGKTVFLIEHDIDFVLRISDTVIVMDDGKKIVEGRPDTIRNNSRHTSRDNPPGQHTRSRIRKEDCSAEYLLHGERRRDCRFDWTERRRKVDGAQGADWPPQGEGLPGDLRIHRHHQQEC